MVTKLSASQTLENYQEFDKLFLSENHLPPRVLLLGSKFSPRKFFTTFCSWIYYLRKSWFLTWKDFIKINFTLQNWIQHIQNRKTGAIYSTLLIMGSWISSHSEWGRKFKVMDPSLEKFINNPLFKRALIREKRCLNFSLIFLHLVFPRHLAASLFAAIFCST